MVGVTGSIPVAPTIQSTEQAEEVGQCTVRSYAAPGLNNPRTVPTCLLDVGTARAKSSCKVLEGPPRPPDPENGSHSAAGTATEAEAADTSEHAQRSLDLEAPQVPWDVTSNCAARATRSQRAARIAMAASRQERHTTALAAALQYAGRGWREIPCRSDKVSRIRNWQVAASCDPETIITWWTQWPNAWIALGMTSTGLAVDFNLRRPRADPATIAGASS